MFSLFYQRHLAAPVGNINVGRVGTGKFENDRSKNFKFLTVAKIIIYFLTLKMGFKIKEEVKDRICIYANKGATVVI